MPLLISPCEHKFLPPEETLRSLKKQLQNIIAIASGDYFVESDMVTIRSILLMEHYSYINLVVLQSLWGKKSTGFRKLSECHLTWNFSWERASSNFWVNNKQILQGHSLNIEVSNIQRGSAELNIISTRVDKSYIQQEWACYICFIINLLTLF